ncbi:MATE family efflux transporter [Aliiglaciecola sp. 3_MG-2023]|uniref:MATE family efflux transporter n=1 Tax=Aliiglaciecola sp. 3_MG-2023 TaxID=3062644 RepID=UPI0026E41A88|nr:MATE family efflux transporter [Aliiglaciecola sp. 3_MG-2023]MDO6694363.1 MATE family efflux transporter [Aliiglaciecola sp. 3_MG-2023]
MPELPTSTASKPLFWQKNAHLEMIALIFPMLLANITAPLMGFVDIAVLGHMEGSHILAGASVATLILTQIYWICGFIRMSATGLSAQAKGQKSTQASFKVFYQSMFSAGIIAVLLLLFQQPILAVGLHFSEANELVSQVIVEYFNVRVWGAPAALANLALIGWLLGQQRNKLVMYSQVFANLLNIVLNLLFVFVFDWQVAGVAAATVIAEYCITLVGLFFVFKGQGILPQREWLKVESLAILTRLNSAMLIRNLALQACLVFMTFQGIRLGVQAAAINALLMQFFVLIALGLDAVAFAVEARVGEAKGASNQRSLKANVALGLIWSSAFAVVYTLVFVLWGNNIIALLTDLPTLQEAAAEFLPIIWLLPIVAHWCFLMDGVFVGLTRANAMRDSMLISAVLVYFPVWWFCQDMGNLALWIALLAFLGARGISLSGYFLWLYRWPVQTD